MFQILATLFLVVLHQAQITSVHSQSVASTSTGGTLPIGTVLLFAGDVIPEGWLLCDGSAISRLNYFPLFLVIGTLYGTGDHVRTFNLPDFRGRFPLGLDGRLSQRSGFNQGGTSEITITVNELPTHTHSIDTLQTAAAGNHAHNVYDPGHNHGGTTNDGPAGEGGRGTVSGGGFHDRGRHTHSIPHGYTGIGIHAGGTHAHSMTGSLGSTGQGKPFRIMNPYQTINYIIYAGPEFSSPTVG